MTIVVDDVNLPAAGLSQFAPFQPDTGAAGPQTDPVSEEFRSLDLGWPERLGAGEDEITVFGGRLCAPVSLVSAAQHCAVLAAINDL